MKTWQKESRKKSSNTRASHYLLVGSLTKRQFKAIIKKASKLKLFCRIKKTLSSLKKVIFLVVLCSVKLTEGEARGRFVG
jgi:hypothetical protein